MKYIRIINTGKHWLPDIRPLISNYLDFMKKRQFQHHVDSLPDNALSVSGGGPAPFDKEAGAFSGSWDWGIIVDPLGPGGNGGVPFNAGGR